MEIKFPTPWKTLIIKFPPPRDSPCQMPGVCPGGMLKLRFDRYITSCWRCDIRDLNATFIRHRTNFLTGWKFVRLGVLFARNHLNPTETYTPSRGFKVPCEQSESIKRIRVYEVSGLIFSAGRKFLLCRVNGMRKCVQNVLLETLIPRLNIKAARSVWHRGRTSRVLVVVSSKDLKVCRQLCANYRKLVKE